MAVIVVVADAAGLSPAASCQPSPRGDVRESSVPIVLEEMTAGIFTSRKILQTPAVYQEDIEPAVLVVVVKCHPAAGRFEEVFVLHLAAVDSFRVKTGFGRHINETDPQWSIHDGRHWPGRGLGLAVVGPLGTRGIRLLGSSKGPRRPRQMQHVCKA